MANRKWKKIKQQPGMLPGPAVPGCCLVSFHFLWAILCPQAVFLLSLPFAMTFAAWGDLRFTKRIVQCLAVNGTPLRSSKKWQQIDI